MAPMNRIAKGIIGLASTIAQWPRMHEEMLPVDAARPSHCAACGAPARLPGRPLQLHGHGKVDRQVLGPEAPGKPPVMRVFWIRRFLCLVCRHVMRVGPMGVPCRRLYSGAAIAWALALILFRGLSQKEVRDRVSPWPCPSGASTWKSLHRWFTTATSGRLWPGLSHSLESVLQTLSTRALDAADEAIEAKIFFGAAHVGRDSFLQNHLVFGPTEEVRSIAQGIVA